MANHPPAEHDVLQRLGQFFLGLTVNQRLLMAGGAALVGWMLGRHHAPEADVL